MGAYSPLARGKLFGQTPLADIAARVDHSEAELAIRWCLERGFVVIPKSVNPDRIQKNFAVQKMSHLSSEDRVALEKLDRGYQSCAAASDAMKIPWEDLADGSPGKGKKGGKGSGKAYGKGW